MSDSTGQLFNQVDTLELLPKMSYEKRMKAQQKELEKWEKEQQKKKKRGEPYDSIPPRQPLEVKFSASGSIAPDQHISIEMPAPLLQVDTAAIHVRMKVDSLWNDQHCTLTASSSVRRYDLQTEWLPGNEYIVDIDSGAFVSIYGVVSNLIKQPIKVKALEEFGTIAVDVSGISDVADTAIVVQLLNQQDKPVCQQRCYGGSVLFRNVPPSKYYLRAFVDQNGNGRWDTGDYDADLQAEAVYYYPEEIEGKAKWDLKRQWNISSTPRYRQKPAAITKQKGDKEKQKLQNRNAQRAKQLGIEYIQNKTGVKL